MLFPNKDEVPDIQRKLIDRFGGLHGIRDEGALDSALMAPSNRQHYEGVDLATCAATYAFHLTKNHPFLDGNKRIGAAVAEIFVRLNGAQLTASDDEIVALFFGIAAGSISRDEVVRAFIRWVAVTPSSAVPT
jgi:death-on-curing protein